MAETVIDEAVFDGLKESVGADYMKELFDAFWEEVPTLLAQLRPTLTVGDVETFRRLAHSVKSNAATFGAIHLFELAKEMELMARENRLEQIGDRLKVLGEAYNSAAGELEG